MPGRLAFCIVLTLFLALGGATAPAAEFDAGAAKALLEDACSRCHHPNRALKKRKDRAGWEKTVSRMKRYAAGLISDEDAAAIVEYLTRERGPEGR